MELSDPTELLRRTEPKRSQIRRTIRQMESCISEGFTTERGSMRTMTTNQSEPGTAGKEEVSPAKVPTP